MQTFKRIMMVQECIAVDHATNYRVLYRELVSKYELNKENIIKFPFALLLLKPDF